MSEIVKKQRFFETSTILLTQKGVVSLEAKLKEDPQNLKFKLQLVDFHRKLGNLDKSLAYLGQIPNEELDSYHQALKAHLSQKGMAEEEEKSISPFILKQDFLNKEELEEVWKIVNNKSGNMRDATTYNEKDSQKERYRPNIRSSTVLDIDSLKPIREWFLEKNKQQLYDLCEGLQIPLFKVAQEELQLTRHRHNDFFKLHTDNNRLKKNRASSRKLTFVYYFFQEPKKFSGGDLLIYDTKAENAAVDKTKFTRIIPKNNSIIFFPPERFHQVTIVNAEGVEDEFTRFTLNGWFH